MATSGASFSPASSNGINFSFVGEALGTVLNARETSLRNTNSGLGENPDQSKLIEMQVGLQKWSMLIQLQSTITKELGDALKGIIQKAG